MIHGCHVNSPTCGPVVLEESALMGGDVRVSLQPKEVTATSLQTQYTDRRTDRQTDRQTGNIQPRTGEARERVIVSP